MGLTGQIQAWWKSREAEIQQSHQYKGDTQLKTYSSQSTFLLLLQPQARSRALQPFISFFICVYFNPIILRMGTKPIQGGKAELSVLAQPEQSLESPGCPQGPERSPGAGGSWSDAELGFQDKQVAGF